MAGRRGRRRRPRLRLRHPPPGPGGLRLDGRVHGLRRPRVRRARDRADGDDGAARRSCASRGSTSSSRASPSPNPGVDRPPPGARVRARSGSSGPSAGSRTAGTGSSGSGSSWIPPIARQSRSARSPTRWPTGRRAASASGPAPCRPAGRRPAPGGTIASAAAPARARSPTSRSARRRSRARAGPRRARTRRASRAGSSPIAGTSSQSYAGFGTARSSAADGGPAARAGRRSAPTDERRERRVQDHPGELACRRGRMDRAVGREHRGDVRRRTRRRRPAAGPPATPNARPTGSVSA